VFGGQWSGLSEAPLDPRPVDREGVDGLLAQLEDEGMTTAFGDLILLPWGGVFDMLESAHYRGCEELLFLPDAAPYVPVLRSFNTLRDRNFTIAIEGWRGPNDVQSTAAEMTGAIIQDGQNLWLASRSAWVLSTQVSRFQDRPDDERDEFSNRRLWGRIRRSAIAANAALNGFLSRSVVLTPEKLRIDLRSSDEAGARVVEIIPGFEGAPARWLTAFDSHRSVLELYNIPTSDGGLFQVIVTPNVKTVLESVKRLLGRRVAGARAEAFLVNPFAALGEAAIETIDEDQFIEARAKVGLLFERFFAHVGRDEHGYPALVAIAIDAPKSVSDIEREIRPFADDRELEEFIGKVEAAMVGGHQLCGWKGYDFEILGETGAELYLLKQVLEERREPRILVSHVAIYDLSGYSARIETIGEEKPFYSPFIAKKDDGDGWFPDNIVPVIAWTPEGESESVAVPLTPKLKEEIRTKTEEATARGEDSIAIKDFERPMRVSDAQRILDTFARVEEAVGNRQFDLPKATGGRTPKSVKHLVIKANVQSIDYEEVRREILDEGAREPVLPSGLRPDVMLKDHQKSGVAWLQRLFDKSPAHCCGAVLADDMGLGKTLQILTLLAWAFERDPSLPPALIVAPVSLLENWEEETTKFLKEGTLSLLTAYGDSLSSLRVPRENIDQQLKADGMVRFLRPHWRGAANAVLTTYETLRDLEFSFAAEKWSVMVCDEAQRIKNPNAMVTRAAKKQKATFRVACTGTPVENTLTDLWCLFDYVQPGLLGALNDFGRRYRRPIEAETDEEKERVAELRARIAPQVLRRTKAEVAKDLPRRYDPPTRVPLSEEQRRLYANAIDLFKRRDKSDAITPFKNHLGLLQYLRLICTDPRPVGQGVFKPEPLDQYRKRSPKLDWLLNTLQVIKNDGEKAIVFCEFRDIQRLLRYYIEQALKFSPDIINGDTAASVQHVSSRQKRIKTFQARPGFGVIILSPVAVGFGVNIQEANHVIHYTRHWNPAKEDQATDRAHRIGQKRQVTVYCPITEAAEFATFDVKLDRLLSAKRELAKDMLNGSGDVAPGDFSLEDMVPADGQAGGFSRQVTLEDVLSMEWDHFEGFVAALWLKKGLETVYRTPTQDGGVDVVGISADYGVLIQCKTSATDGRHLGWDAVRDVVAGAAAYEKTYPDVVFRKVCVTNQFFNDSAKQQARLNQVDLVDQDDLADLVNRYQVSKLDVERVLFATWRSAG
jgi:hypothetical protein